MKGNNTIHQTLRKGKERLKEAGKENYAYEAELLLMEACGLRRVELFTKGDQLLLADQKEKYESYLAEREENRPLQYILGQCEFMGLPFFVGEGVLIPRSDTEVLVETVLEIAKQENLQKVIDVGTGSGCIPICLAHYGKLQAFGIDISPKALGFAMKNGEKNKVDIGWMESDLFSQVPLAWEGTFDAIVSNPPYIAKAVIDGLMPEVRDFEPRSALDGGEDGLDFYRRLVEESQDWLRDGGWIFFEIGHDQGQALLFLLEDAGFEQCTLRKDFAGLDRVVFGKLGRKHR